MTDLTQMEENKRIADAGLIALNEILEFYSERIQQDKEIEMLTAKNKKLENVVNNLLKKFVKNDSDRIRIRREAGIIL